MRIKGYSNVKAANQSLQQQVRREAEKLKGEAIPCPPPPVAAAASSLMALSATANVGRPALQTILPNPATIVTPFVTVGGGKAVSHEALYVGPRRQIKLVPLCSPSVNVLFVIPVRFCNPFLPIFNHVYLHNY